MRRGCFSGDHATQDLRSRSFILQATGKRPASPKQECDKIRFSNKRKTFKRG